MAQCVKALLDQPKDLNSMSRTCMVETCPLAFPCLLYKLTSTHVHKQTNKYLKNLSLFKKGLKTSSSIF